MDEQGFFPNVLHLPQTNAGRDIVRNQIIIGIREFRQNIPLCSFKYKN